MVVYVPSPIDIAMTASTTMAIAPLRLGTSLLVNAQMVVSARANTLGMDCGDSPLPYKEPL